MTGLNASTPASIPLGRLLLALAVGLGCIGSSRGQTPVRLFGPDLEPHDAVMVSIDSGWASYFDADGVLRQSPLGQFVRIERVADAHPAVQGGVDAGSVASAADRAIDEAVQTYREGQGGIEPSERAPGGPEEEITADAPAASQKSQPRSGILVTVDGQRFRGEWVRPTAELGGERVGWWSSAVGGLAVPLDRVAWFALGPVRAESLPDAGGDDDAGGHRWPDEEPDWAEGVGDTVLLGNGDRLRGFLLGLDVSSEPGGPGVLRLMPTGGDAAVNLPMDRVAGVALSNPRLPPDSALARVRLADGSRLLTDRLLWRDGRLGVRPLGVEVSSLGPAVSGVGSADRREFTAGMLRGIDVMIGAAQPLDVRPEDVSLREGGTAFGVSFTPDWQGDRLRVHAPATLSVDLPPGAGRVAFELGLDDSGPEGPEVIRWADVGVEIQPAERGFDGVLRPIGAPLGFVLEGESWRRRVNLAVDETVTSLIIRLDSGRRGAVLDRVVVEGWLVVSGD